MVDDRLRDERLFWVYLFLFVTCIAAVIGSFFDAIRPYGLVTIGVAVTSFLVVAGLHGWPDVPREQRTRTAVVVMLGVAAGIELVVVGGLSVLYPPWRTVGVWLLATGAVLSGLFWLLLRPIGGPMAHQRAHDRPATDQPAAGGARPSDWDISEGWWIAALVVVVVIAVCVPPWRTGAIIVLVACVSFMWWTVCGVLAVTCWPSRDHGLGRAVAGVVAAVAAVAAGLLPIAASGAFRLPPVRQLVAHTGPPPGGWWSGLIIGVAGFVVLSTITLVTTPSTPTTTREPESPIAAQLPSEPVRTGPAAIEDMSFSPVAKRAMTMAVAALPPGQLLTTGRVLAALVQADVLVGWQRIWLHTGGFNPGNLVSAPDPPDDAQNPQTWRGVAMSGRLAASMHLALRIGERYRLVAGSTGVLTLGLVAHRGNGATEALLAGGGLTHGELLWRVQIDVLGSTLEDLSAVIPAAQD